MLLSLESEWTFFDQQNIVEVALCQFGPTFFFLVAVLCLRCCSWAFSSCGEWGLLFVAVRGLLIAVASLVAEHGL